MTASQGQRLDHHNVTMLRNDLEFARITCEKVELILGAVFSILNVFVTRVFMIIFVFSTYEKDAIENGTACPEFADTDMCWELLRVDRLSAYHLYLVIYIFIIWSITKDKSREYFLMWVGILWQYKHFFHHAKWGVFYKLKCARFCASLKKSWGHNCVICRVRHVVIYDMSDKICLRLVNIFCQHFCCSSLIRRPSIDIYYDYWCGIVKFLVRLLSTRQCWTECHLSQAIWELKTDMQLKFQ